jgi:hypothetical protein
MHKKKKKKRKHEEEEGKEEQQEETSLPPQLTAATRAMLMVKCLQNLGAPRQWVYLVFLVMTCDLLCQAPYLSLVEYFSGAQELTNASLRQGRTSLGYDFINGAHMNFMAILGFIYAINVATLVMPSHQSHAAPQCSSYTWMNSGTSQRTKTSPMGNVDEPTVRMSNCMGARVSRK